ncbi:hypothetical protein Btru_060455 [Bulinus truncatus]|nr:hypothetical protein Btru_060455 [Bulinus truncatus]
MAANYVRRKRLNKEQRSSVWRNGQWVEAYTRGSQVINTGPMTAGKVVRMISTAVDRQQYLHCAMLVNQMKSVTPASILSHVSVDRLHSTLPASLPVLEVLYLKIYYSPEKEFLTVYLMTDQLVKKLITLFALDAYNQTTVQMYQPYCRTIMAVIATVDGQFQTKVAHRKEALDRCLRNMGQHGLVSNGSGETFMTLHDALKREMEKSINHLKSALHQLDQLWMSNKHPVIKLTSDESLSTEVCHQRMMQVNRDFVVERLYKNKSLLNSLEPVITDRYIDDLIETLQNRIENDKILLFHESELRKMSGDNQIPDLHVSQLLAEYYKGYSVLLGMLVERRSTGQHFLSSSEGDVNRHTRQQNVADESYEPINQNNHNHVGDQCKNSCTYLMTGDTHNTSFGKDFT